MRKVVITGMGAVTPIGNDVPSLWDAMMKGTNGIAPITRFDTTDFKATLAAEVKDFNPEPYLSKGEVRKTDLFVQYGIVAAQQAVEDSQITEHIDPKRFGVYFGSGVGGFGTMAEEQSALLEKGPRRISPQFVPKMISNIAAGNIAIRTNAQGPCLSISTACATGTTCIGEAFRAVRDGYADAIIAGGSEASIIPLAVAGFINCMALTTTDDVNAASIPFDKRRSGFVMGEGAGALIVEDYEHAKARGAKIYCELVGYGSTCDAFHVTAPSPEAEGGAEAIRQAVMQAGGAEGHSIYINAHGTSTPLNDKTETLAIKKALGEEIAKTVKISSTKSMTGHMLGAAGAVEAIASILALQKGIIPPTINLCEADEECDLDYTPNVPCEKEITLALSTSLGFGGHNACIAFKKES
ncbi:MAG: beta-ketoacyl-[acyl-carrier-protein] synthase II [Ruminococcaceae bacterium]|nr:beta-ketoacyl-[acyl-carrier-protein] synthase II [Oscillospiraceae bacterium]